jgi:hypothetical protein
MKGVPMKAEVVFDSDKRDVSVYYGNIAWFRDCVDDLKAGNEFALPVEHYNMVNEAIEFLRLMEFERVMNERV